MSLPRVVFEHEDFFLDELPGLPLYMDVDFTIELHPSASPISMISYRMAPIELQELMVQLQELLDKGFSLHLGVLRCCFPKRKTRPFGYVLTIGS